MSEAEQRERSTSAVSVASDTHAAPRSRSNSSAAKAVSLPTKKGGSKRFLINEFSTDDADEEAPPTQLEDSDAGTTRWLGVKPHPSRSRDQNGRTGLALGAGLGSFDELGFFIHDDTYDNVRETKSAKRLREEQRAKDAALDILSAINEREIAKQTRVVMAAQARRAYRQQQHRSTRVSQAPVAEKDSGGRDGRPAS